MDREGRRGRSWVDVLPYIVSLIWVIAAVIWGNWYFHHAPNGQPTVIGLSINGHQIFYHRWEYYGPRERVWR